MFSWMVYAVMWYIPHFTLCRLQLVLRHLFSITIVYDISNKVGILLMKACISLKLPPQTTDTVQSNGEVVWH